MKVRTEYDSVLVIDLVTGDIRKYLHNCNCIFTIKYVIFLITYIHYAYIIWEGDLRSLSAYCVALVLFSV